MLRCVVNTLVLAIAVQIAGCVKSEMQQRLEPTDRVFPRSRSIDLQFAKSLNELVQEYERVDRDMFSVDRIATEIALRRTTSPQYHYIVERARDRYASVILVEVVVVTQSGDCNYTVIAVGMDADRIELAIDPQSFRETFETLGVPFDVSGVRKRVIETVDQTDLRDLEFGVAAAMLAMPQSATRDASTCARSIDARLEVVDLIVFTLVSIHDMDMLGDRCALFGTAMWNHSILSNALLFGGIEAKDVPVDTGHAELIRDLPMHILSDWDDLDCRRFEELVHVRRILSTILRVAWKHST